MKFWILLILILHGLCVLSTHADERRDRLVDRAAILEISRAIEGTQAQLRRVRDPSLEEKLSFKLADLQYQRSQLEFRVGTHERNEARYHQSLRETIGTLNTLARRFPRTDEMPRLLWIRARAQEDLARNRDAESDYRRITTDFPDFEQVDSARMALGRLRMERGDHRGAIEAYAPLRSLPNSPFHPLALQQLAWSHANLAEFDTALERIEQAVAAADPALAEQLLGDFATFAADQLEKNGSSGARERAGVAAIWARLHAIHRQIPLGPAALRMAKLLRAKAMTAELKEWVELLWSHPQRDASTVGADLLLREHAEHRQDWNTALEVLGAGRVAGSPPGDWESHRRFYAAIQQRIQDLLKKNPDAPAAKALPWLGRLSSAYQAFLAVTTDSGDPRVVAAEIGWLRAELAMASLRGVRRKFAISPRNSTSSPSTPLAPEARKVYDSLLSRMDRVIPLLPPEQQPPVRVERARMLYEQGNPTESLREFRNLAFLEHESNERRAGLAALLDQAIADEDRGALEELLAARSGFHGDAGALKLLEQATLQLELLILKNPRNPDEKSRVIESLAGRLERAEELPPEIAARIARERASMLLASRGPSALEQVHLLLSLRKEESETRRLLSFALGKDQGPCSESLCIQLRWSPNAPLTRSEAQALLRRLLKRGVPAWERTLIGMTLLTASGTRLEDSAFQDQALALRAITRGWKDLHPLAQWRMLPHWLPRSHSVLSSLPASLRKAPSLAHRMELIRSSENLVRDLQQMGILETSIAALETHSGVLSDFSKDAARLDPNAAALSAEAESQARELQELAAGQRDSLARAVEAHAPRLERARKLQPPDFDPSMPGSQVWALLKGPDLEAVSVILWQQGARHAASQLQ